MRTVTRSGIDFLVVSDTQNKDFWDRDTWGETEYALLKKEAHSHSVFVHAGGWIGPFTLFAGKLFKRVYCLEPDPVAFDELKTNVELNKLDNVTLERRSFYGTEGNFLMGSAHSPLGMSGTSLFQTGTDNQFLTQAVTLSQFFTGHDIPKNSFLMLDVEGAEFALFKDTSFFEKFTPTILVSFHFKMFDHDNLNYLIYSLKKLQHLYDIDIPLLIKSWETYDKAPDYGAIDCLYKPKAS